MSIFGQTLSASLHEARVERLARERGSDIHQFIRGLLPAAERQAFVDELRAEPLLREAVGRQRAELHDDEVAISERALMLEARIQEGFKAGASFFPGARGLEGYGNHEGIKQVREEWFHRAIEACQDLLCLHELEDLAIENLERAQLNIQRGRQAQRQCSEGTPGLPEPLEIGAQHLYAPPIPLQVRPVAQKPVAELLKYGLNNPRSRRELVHSLPQLYPSDDGRFPPSEVLAPFRRSREAGLLLKKISREPALLESLLEEVERPAYTSDIKEAAARKLVAARFIAIHCAQNGETEPFRRLVSTFHNLRTALEGSGGSTCSALTFAGLSHILLGASQREDSLWKMAREPVLDAVEKGFYGPPRELAEHQTVVLLEALQHVRERVRTDPAFARAVAGLPAGMDRAEAKRASIPLLQALSAPVGVPLLLDLARIPSEESRDARGDGYIAPSPAGCALRALREYSDEELGTVSLPPDAADLSGTRPLSVARAVDNLLSARMESDAFGADYAEYEVACLDLLVRLDRGTMRVRFSEVLSGLSQGEQWEALHSMTGFAHRHGLSCFDDEFLGLIAAGSFKDANPLIEHFINCRGYSYEDLGDIVAARAPLPMPRNVVELFGSDLICRTAIAPLAHTAANGDDRQRVAAITVLSSFHYQADLDRETVASVSRNLSEGPDAARRAAQSFLEKLFRGPVGSAKTLRSEIAAAANGNGEPVRIEEVALLLGLGSPLQIPRLPDAGENKAPLKAALHLFWNESLPLSTLRLFFDAIRSGEDPGRYNKVVAQVQDLLGQAYHGFAEYLRPQLLDPAAGTRTLEIVRMAREYLGGGAL